MLTLDSSQAEPEPPEKGQPSYPRTELRIEFVDALRGLAALYVMLYHAFQITFQVQGSGIDIYNQNIASTDKDRLTDLFNHLMYYIYNIGFRYGHYAVVIFIVLSGYSLMLPVARSREGLLKKGTLNFFKRRARRILPPYYVALVISLLLIALVPGLNISYNGRAWWDDALPALEPGPILAHIALIHNWFPSYVDAINPAMWSIPLEFQLYFTLPFFLLPVWRKYGALTMVGLAIALSVVFHFLFKGRIDYAYPWFLGLFAMDAFAASVGFSKRLIDSRRLYPLPWGIITILSLMPFIILDTTKSIFPVFSQENTAWVKDLLIGLASASLVIYCTKLTLKADKKTRFNPLRLLNQPKLVKLGWFSYSLYLIHVPILMVNFVFWNSLNLPYTITHLAGLFCSILTSLLLAYGFHLVFERPFMTVNLNSARLIMQRQDQTI